MVERFWPHARLGFTDPAMPTGVFACPKPSELCAVAGGYAYVIDTEQPERFTHIALETSRRGASSGGAGAVTVCRLPHNRGMGPRRTCVGVGATELGGSSHHWHRGRRVAWPGMELDDGTERLRSRSICLRDNIRGADLLNRRKRKKAECCVALLQQSGMFKRTVARSKFDLAAVFRNNHCVGSQESARPRTLPKKLRVPAYSSSAS